MKRAVSIFPLVLLFLSFIYISGCGGGGSSSETESANVQITSSNGDGANITIYSYNQDGSKKYDEISDKILGTSISKAVKMYKNGGYILVNVTKEGYVDFSKKISFSKPHDISLDVTLYPVQSESVIPVNNSNITISSTGKKVIKIALIKKENGKKVIVTGNKIRTLNGIPEYTMEIPLNAIPSGTKALKVRLTSFNPKKDADKFPGDYIDENGNKLLSLGFNYVDIRDANTGERIFNENPSTTASVNFRITRWINGDVCDNLINDFCTGSHSDNSLCSSLTQDELNGYNVPFYRYNSITGKWELLGIGTIDINNDKKIDINDTVNNSFNAIQQCQNNNGFNTIIVITNPNFTYCNLDYPVVNPPTELCFIKTFKDINNQPFTNVIVWLEDDDNKQSFLYSSTGIPDTSGTVKLKTWNIRNDGDRDATLYYRYLVKVDGDFLNIVKSEPITLGDDLTNCPSKTNTIDLTEKVCKVQGKIEFDDGSPAKGIWISITDNKFTYIIKYTDDQGNFSAIVPCDRLMYLYTGLNQYDEEIGISSIAKFKANGQIEYDEQKDETQPQTSSYKYIVTLDTIQQPVPNYTLYILKNGKGNVTSSPQGIDCGKNCFALFEKGTSVELTATPDSGYKFTGWSGNCSSCTNATCTVIMDSSKVCTANFKSTQPSNNPPVINSFTANPTSGNAPLTVTFNWNVSDTDGDTLICYLDIDNDGNVDYTINKCENKTSQTYTYNNGGTYTAKLTVTDSHQHYVSKIVTITVSGGSTSINMTGVWEGNYQGNDGSKGQICVELQQTNNTLSGNLYIQGQGHVGSVTGNLSGNNINFGIAAGVQYSGTVSNNGNSANGTYDEDRDGTNDGTWQIERTDKSSCGWIPSNIEGDLLGAAGLLSFRGIITDISTITVNNNGNTENGWYTFVIRYVDNITGTNLPYLVAEKPDRTLLFKSYYNNSSNQTVAELDNKSQNTIYVGNLATNPFSNENFSNTPIYESKCVSSKKAKLYKGTTDVGLPDITLRNVTSPSDTRTFGIPSQVGITAYKLEVSSCP